MRIWMLNRNLEDFKAAQQYCGFASEEERKPIGIGDKVVYVCNGIVLGVFEAEKLVQKEFDGWREKLPFQVKLKPIVVPEKGLVASPLHYKTQLQKHVEGSSSLWQLSEWEYNKMMQALREGRKELVF